LGVLTFSSILSAVGLYYLSYSKTAAAIVLAATIFGFGKAFFWPTMVGVVSEQFPKGGAFLMGLMGGMGMFCAGWLMSPIMGAIQDHYALSALPEKAYVQVVTDNGLDERKVMQVTDPEVTAAVDQAKKYSAEMTYRWVSLVPAVLAFVFFGLFLGFRKRGGYRAVSIAKQTGAIGATS
jgi:MFS family permease